MLRSQKIRTPPGSLTKPADQGSPTQPPAKRTSPAQHQLTTTKGRAEELRRRSPEETRRRPQIIGLLLGGSGGSESVGLAPIRLAVIETDGSLEQVDTLKTAFPGAAAIGHPPVGNPLDHALWQPQIIARQVGIEALCQTCRDCPVHQICGAGNYTHRYREDNGFMNPSVYCADLGRLIEHVWKQICPDIDALLNSRVSHAAI